VLTSRPVTLFVAAVVGALFLAGLAVHGFVGGVMLAVVAGGLVILSAAAWQHIPSRGRAFRVAIVIAVTALAVAKLVDRL
jgi:hypothetical protein